MKNFYPKAKGRIHPSPSSLTTSPRSEALSVLQILPVAIFALTSALGNGDKEVLAYLIVRSIGGLEETAEQRRCGKTGEVHTRLFGCGCFDCYTTFWSRWDCSPDRELIHQAIEAFEDHLTTSERAGAGAGSHARGKRRERRVGDVSEKGKRKGKEKERVGEDVSVEEETGEGVGEEAEKGDEGAVEVAASEGAAEGVVVQTVAGGGGERRKGWADVTAIFNSRLWSLWSPGD